MTKFEESMKQLKGEWDIEAFKAVWNMAVEECAKIADGSLEQELAHVYREYVKEK